MPGTNYHCRISITLDEHCKGFISGHHISIKLSLQRYHLQLLTKHKKHNFSHVTTTSSAFPPCTIPVMLVKLKRDWTLDALLDPCLRWHVTRQHIRFNIISWPKHATKDFTVLQHIGIVRSNVDVQSQVHGCNFKFLKVVTLPGYSHSCLDEIRGDHSPGV